MTQMQTILAQTTVLSTTLNNTVIVGKSEITQDALPESLVMARVITNVILRHVVMILEIAAASALTPVMQLG